MKSSKYSLLIKDTMLFALSSFVPKAISFFLVPLYTNCLTTTEYGIFEIILTLVSLLYPILSLGIDHALLRFTIDSKSDIKPYILTCKLVAKGIILIFFVVLINITLNIFEIDSVYQWYFVLSYVMYAINYVNTAYLRAIYKIKLLSVTSIINSFVTIILNVLTLAVFGWGIKGYLLSNVAGLLIANIIVIILNFNELKD